MTPARMAERLVAARETHDGVPWREVCPADRAGAYAVQDATVSRLGAVGGWKVGGPSREAEPAAAPCLRAGILNAGATLTGPDWRMRGVEVEVGLRLGRDLAPGGALLPPDVLQAAVAAVLPLIEVVETRLADHAGSDPLAQLADLQNHGALVLGEPADLDPAALDLTTVEAELRFEGQMMAATRGGNPASDVWRSLAWLARHCEERGRPLRAGDIVTTGSCTGLLCAEADTRVEARIAGLGEVTLRF